MISAARTWRIRPSARETPEWRCVIGLDEMEEGTVCKMVCFALVIGALSSATERALCQSRLLPGITFVADTSADIIPPGTPAADAVAMLKSLGLKVTYAGERGRIDILARPERPAIRIGELAFAKWLAVPGDYYLFDSTAFILVRSSTKQFFSFRLADGSFNYAGRRDGWPGFFAARPTPFGTIDDATSPALLGHGELPIFWHLDVLRDTVCVVGNCSVEELARGRTPILDAPPEELTIVRWFGPAAALARIPGGVERFSDKPIRITTTSTATNISGLHRLLDLRSTAVDARSLMLPPDFSEALWPGFDKAEQSVSLSADLGARWRKLP